MTSSYSLRFRPVKNSLFLLSNLGPFCTLTVRLETSSMIDAGAACAANKAFISEVSLSEELSYCAINSRVV